MAQTASQPIQDDSNLETLSEKEKDQSETLDEESERVDRLQERQEIYRESDLERVDLDLERKEPDQMAIERIDINKSPEEQRQDLDIFESSCYGIIIRLFAENTPENINNYAKLLMLNIPESDNENEKSARKKLLEIAGNPDSKVGEYFAPIWKAKVEEAYKTYEITLQTKTDIENGNEENEDVKFYKKHPYRTAGLISLGALGGFLIYRWLRKKSEKVSTKPSASSEKKGIFSKIFDVGKYAALGIGAFTIGVMLGPDKWKGWVKENMGIDLTPEGLKKFWGLIKQGKIREAFGGLREEAEKLDPELEKAASVIGIDAKYLAMYISEEAEYENFLQNLNSKTFLYDVYKHIPNVRFPFIFNLQEEKKVQEAEIKIGKFLKKHQKTIKEKLPEAKTLEEVLLGLENLEIIDQELSIKETQETIDPQNTLTEDEQEYEEFLESIKHAPHLTEVVEKWHDQEWSLTKIYEYVPEIVAAAWEDKVPIITHGTKTFLFDGTKLVTITSFVTLTKAFNEVMEGDFPGAVKEYSDGAKILIPVGAIIGALYELIKRDGGIVKGAIRGAIKGSAYGFLTPAAVPYKGAHAAKKVWIKGRMHSFNVIGTLRGQPKETYQLARTQYLYKVLKNYCELEKALTSEVSWKEPGRKAYARLNKARILKLQQEYAGLFMKTYNQIWKNHNLPFIRENKDGKFNVGEIIKEIEKNEISRNMLNPTFAKFDTPQQKGKFVPGKNRRYTFRGEIIEFTTSEQPSLMTEGAIDEAKLKAECERKWMNKQLEQLHVKEIKMKKGKFNIKINGEIKEIDISGTRPTPAELDAAKKNYLEELVKNGRNVEIVKNTKLMKHFIKLEKLLGTAMAAIIIYELETAENQPRKLAELAVSISTFIAGAAITHKYLSSRLPGAGTNPKMRLVAHIMSIMGGIAISFGLDKPIMEIIEKFNISIPGRYEVSEEITSMIEKGFTRQMLATKLGKKLMSQTLIKLFSKLGIKGAIIGSLALDDAFIIGVIDDLLLIPMAIWMGKDAIDIVLAIVKNYRIQNELEKVNELEETIISQEVQGDRTIIQITYPNHPRIHEWTLYETGEALRIRILDPDGEVYAEVTEEDAEWLNKKLKEEHLEESEQGIPTAE